MNVRYSFGRAPKGQRWSSRAMVAIFATLLFAAFAAPTVSASIPDNPQPSDIASWVNKNTIRYGDKQFVDSNPGDNKYQFVYEGSGGCKSYLIFTVNPYSDTGGQTAKQMLNNPNNSCKPILSGISENVSIGNRPNRLSNDTTPDTDNTQTNATCETNFTDNPLSWILCPIFNGVAGLSDFILDKLIAPMLKVNMISTSPKDATYQIWSAFRIYANIFLVVALLIIVFGQSIGGGVVDAYTAKKVLPKLVISAIGINLSLYVAALMVDVFNILGQGVGQIITAPLASGGLFGFKMGWNTSAGIVETFGAVAIITKMALSLSTIVTSGAGSIGAFILLFIVLPIVVTLIGAFVVVLLRQAFILALVLFSPVAFALYALPNTEKYFKKWWEWLMTTLIVYPILMILFAVCDVMSVTVLGLNGDANVLAAIIAFVLQFLPLLLVLFAFRLAGGIMGKAVELATNYGKRTSEAIKGNPNNPNSLRNVVKGKASNAVLAGATTKIGDLRDISNKEANGFRGRMRRRRAIAQMALTNGLLFDTDKRRSDMNDAFDKEVSNKVANGGDYLERAFFAKRWDGPDTMYRDANGGEQWLRQGRYYSVYKSQDGVYKQHSAGDVRAAHLRYDGNESQIQSLIKYEIGKIPNDSGLYGTDRSGNVIYDPARADEYDPAQNPLGSFMSNLPGTLTSARLSPDSFGRASVGAFFSVQGGRREMKHISPQFNDNGQFTGWKQNKHDFVQDFAEHVGSYSTANGNTSPVERLKNIHQELVAERAKGPLKANWATTERDLLKIADTLDNRMRGIGPSLMVGQTDDNVPISSNASGGAGRVNAAIAEFVAQVKGTQPPQQQQPQQNGGAQGGGIITPGSSGFNIPPGSRP